MVPLQHPIHPNKAQIQVPWWFQAPSVQSYPFTFFATQTLVRDVYQIPSTGHPLPVQSFSQVLELVSGTHGCLTLSIAYFQDKCCRAVGIMKIRK